jgi:hypothetical protein
LRKDKVAFGKALVQEYREKMAGQTHLKNTDETA